MNPAISKIEKVFSSAIEIDDARKRAEYVAAECHDDMEQQAKINRMLSLHFQSDNVLDHDAREWLQPEPDHNLEVGTHIGPYKLLEKIGVGGMGAVFRGEQSEPVRREVAIKIIKPGADNKNVIARFESERQALALMQHPNITRFIDAGVTDSGRPYFVMELISGLPITKYADSNRLPPRQRILLFHEVCNAIQHAHQKGVIHRDIKPSNILVAEVDGKPIPKVIDFGIAKAINQPLTEQSLHTSYGNILGTPEYMSPEQAELSGLDMDACSDVYSLGVLLHELMTGSTPLVEFKTRGLLKFCDAICNVEPAFASTRINSIAETENELIADRSAGVRNLKQFIKGDIDWIIAKCLQKKRNDRYPTAAALAEDVQRFIDGKSISAMGPSAGYRIKKFVARNRVLVTSALGLTISLVMATTVSTFFAFRAYRAETRTRDLLHQSEVSKNLAENERDRAIAAEERIRELERTSRLEASISQAIVRYFNQDNQQAKAAETIAAKPAPKKSAMTVRVSSKGRVAMVNSDGESVFEYAIRSEGEPLAQSTRLQLTELSPQERDQAKKVLALISDEVGKRFGSHDLFVAEPKILLAEMELQDGNFKKAEGHLRQSSLLFVNNFSKRALITRTLFLQAIVLAKQDHQSGEAITILRRTHKYLSTQSFSKDANQLIEKMVVAFEQPESENKQQLLESVLDDLPKIQDEILEEVFESMEVELQRRTKRINAN